MTDILLILLFQTRRCCVSSGKGLQRRRISTPCLRCSSYSGLNLPETWRHFWMHPFWVSEEYCMKILALCQRLDKIRHAQTFSFLRLFFWKQGLNEQKYWFWLKCVIFTSGLNYQDSLSKFQSYWLARPLEVVGRAVEILHVLLPYLTKLAIWECLIRRKIFTHDGLQVNKGLTFSNRVQHQM